MEDIHISTTILGVIGGLISILLAIIAVFLNRLLAQFDNLQDQFGKLNATMLKIDKDISGDVGVLKVKVNELDTVWDRIRDVEENVIAIKSGGCGQAFRHQQ